MKYWTGNSKTTFIVLGASNHSKGERQEVDYYATDPHALSIFLDKLELDVIKLPKKICEPSCSAGHLSEKLKRRGFEVISYDQRDAGSNPRIGFSVIFYFVARAYYLRVSYYGYGIVGQDVLKSEIKAKCFLTNPPYKFALEFTKQAIKNVLPKGYVIMFLRIQFLEGKKRNKFFKKYPPKYVYVNSSRQNCAKNGNFITYNVNSAISYAWFVWQKGFKGEPVIRWLD